MDPGDDEETKRDETSNAGITTPSRMSLDNARIRKQHLIQGNVQNYSTTQWIMIIFR